tara:strand:+ start:31411 stop:31782 length:372 start_codon:yes stop_codon:yes gene_type:complete
MVKHYNYDKPPRVALDSIKEMLQNEGFKIAEYAPEDGFMYTDYRIAYWGKNQYQFALIIQVKDKITFTGMGKLDLPTSGLGDPNKIMKTQVMERLPYRLQRNEFAAINRKMDSLGYQELNHWP